MVTVAPLYRPEKSHSFINLNPFSLERLGEGITRERITREKPLLIST